MRQLTIQNKTIRYYTTQNGKTPYSEWFCSFKDSIIRNRVRRRIERMESGLYGDYKVIGDGLCELRLDFGSGYRIYFTEQGSDIVILFCGGNKSTQKKDIEIAHCYLKELTRRTL